MRSIFAFLKKSPGTDEIIIREAKPDDAQGIINVMRSVGSEKIFTVSEYFPMTEEEERDFIKRLDRKKDMIFVAAKGKDIVGCLTLFRYYGGRSPKVQHVGEIGISIISSYRNQKIGSRLLEFAIDWAAKHDYEKLCLSVFSTNEIAIHVYKKFGFEEEGIRKKQFIVNGIYVDEIIMGKFLTR